MESLWKVYGKFMESLWKVYGKLWGSFLKIFRKSFLKIFSIRVLKKRLIFYVIFRKDMEKTF
jgi:hypothetical protein